MIFIGDGRTVSLCDCLVLGAQGSYRMGDLKIFSENANSTQLNSTELIVVLVQYKY